jgi:hypothetical protein
LRTRAHKNTVDLHDTNHRINLNGFIMQKPAHNLISALNLHPPSSSYYTMARGGKKKAAAAAPAPATAPVASPAAAEPKAGRKRKAEAEPEGTYSCSIIDVFMLFRNATV